WFSQSSQLFQDYEYPIFLAEVASTFNEELLTHHLLQTTSDPKMRAYIIDREIDDLRGTLFRQTMFTEFEKIIHAIEESGDALTLDVFKSEYHKLLEAYFAENFVLDPELDLECLRIPHFYHAFYVYKYATGISAAVALSQRVVSGDSGSMDPYLNFLRSGGSRFPLETLKAVGVDMATPAPIESTLKLFERRFGKTGNRWSIFTAGFATRATRSRGRLTRSSWFGRRRKESAAHVCCMRCRNTKSTSTDP